MPVARLHEEDPEVRKTRGEIREPKRSYSGGTKKP